MGRQESRLGDGDTPKAPALVGKMLAKEKSALVEKDEMAVCAKEPIGVPSQNTDATFSEKTNGQ